MQGSLQRIERNKGLTKVEEGSREGGQLGLGVAEEGRCQRILEACSLRLAPVPGPSSCCIEGQRTAVSLIGVNTLPLPGDHVYFTWGSRPGAGRASGKCQSTPLCTGPATPSLGMAEEPPRRGDSNRSGQFCSGLVFSAPPCILCVERLPGLKTLRLSVQGSWFHSSQGLGAAK